MINQPVIYNLLSINQKITRQKKMHRIIPLPNGPNDFGLVNVTQDMLIAEDKFRQCAFTVSNFKWLTRIHKLKL